MPDIFEADDMQKDAPAKDAVAFEPPPPVQPEAAAPPVDASVSPSDTNTPPAPKPLMSHSENHIHALASYCQHPEGIHFNTQTDDEDILLFLRGHFATNAAWIIMTIFFAFLPIILAMVIPQFSPDSIFSFIPASYILVLFCFYYLILFAYAFINFITWLYNIFFVTTKRIVDVDFSNIVFHQVGATKKDLIEDVHYDQIGFIPTLLDFGTVFVATASEVPIFEATNVPHPGKAVNVIEGLIGKKGHH